MRSTQFRVLLVRHLQVQQPAVRPGGTVSLCIRRRRQISLLIFFALLYTTRPSKNGSLDWRSLGERPIVWPMAASQLRVCRLLTFQPGHPPRPIQPPRGCIPTALCSLVSKSQMSTTTSMKIELQHLIPTCERKYRLACRAHVGQTSVGCPRAASRGLSAIIFQYEPTPAVQSLSVHRSQQATDIQLSSCWWCKDGHDADACDVQGT